MSWFIFFIGIFYVAIGHGWVEAEHLGKTDAYVIGLGCICVSYLIDIRNLLEKKNDT